MCVCVCVWVCVCVCVCIIQINSQQPHWCYPNCPRLVWRQSRALTLPKLCVICSKIILVAEALRCNADECREIFVHCVCRGEWTTSVTQRAWTVLYRSQRGVTIPSFILFPACTEWSFAGILRAQALSKHISEIALYRTWGIFIWDTAYSIVIQWNIHNTKGR